MPRWSLMRSSCQSDYNETVDFCNSLIMRQPCFFGGLGTFLYLRGRFNRNNK